MPKHSSRTALITGASRGLGFALAQRLAAQGWSLVIDARDPAALEAARAELSELTQVLAVPGDVTDAHHRRALARAAQETGGLDAVVNNASILGPSPQPPLLDYPLQELEEVYRANAVAPLAVVQAVQDELRPGARIVNLTSDAAVEPYEGWGGYGSSKAALEQLSAILAAENPQLRVYRADPGGMRTRMHQQAFPDEDISDRPLPEESVPGLVHLLTGDLPSGRYALRDLEGASEGAGGDESTVRELRVALTVDDFKTSAAIYGGALRLPVIREWAEPEGRGIIFAAGPSTIEVVDRAQAELIDRVEAGEEASGPVRLAFEVADVEASAAGLLRNGATSANGSVRTPWGHLNRRLETPDGLQLTLFQTSTEKEMV